MKKYSVTYIIFSTALVVFFTTILLAPLMITVAKSLQGKGFANYTQFFSVFNIIPYFTNSVIISFITVAFIMVFSLLAAFAFSKLQFRLRTPLFLFILCALMLPGATVIMPIHNVVSALKLINTRYAIVLPYVALISPMVLLMLKSHMDVIPGEIMESARIDGCSNFRFLITIVIPLSKPAITVSVIWSFLCAWNEFLFASILLQTSKFHTITLFPIYVEGDKYHLDEPARFAAYVVCMIPMFVLYLLVHKHIEKGFIASGSLKG